MAYTFGARLDDDSYALTTIDEDQGTASTKGEINGVPFESGGGGSSDFSTAEVAVVNNADYEANWNNCPTLNLEDNILIGSFYLESLSSITVLVPLYKGKCLWDIGSRGLTLTGNIEEYEDGLLITGDCSITIS